VDRGDPGRDPVRRPLSRLRVELHCHTNWSGDCGVEPHRLVEAAQRKGIDVLAITDHSQIDGAFEAHAVGALTIIIGEEIKTDRGELLGYFLKEFVPPGMSVLDTARAIKEQGGIISVPHPFDRYRSSAIEREALYEVAGELDMVEIFNSRNISAADNATARDFQKERGLVAAVGSDAHSRMELARSYQEIDSFDGAGDFLTKMAGARLTTRKSSHLIHFVSTYQKLRKRITGRGIPAGLRR